MRDQRIKDKEPSDPETDERLRGVSPDEEEFEDAEDTDEEDADDDEEGGF